MTSRSLILLSMVQNPKILKFVVENAFLNALTCFSPGVHQISPRYHRFWARQSAVFLEFCQFSASGVHTKMNNNLFTLILLLSPNVCQYFGSEKFCASVC